MGGSRWPLPRRWIVTLVLLGCVGGIVTPASASAAPSQVQWWKDLAPSSATDDPVAPPLRPATSAPAIKDAPSARPAAAALPAAGLAEVTLGGVGDARRAGRSPLALAARSAAAGGQAVAVRVLDHAAAARAGVSGFAFRLSARGRAPLPVTVSVDYAAFGEAYGAGYADRLRLVKLPDCALASPVPAGCRRAPVPLPTRNQRAERRLVAEVADLAAVGVLAVTAGPEGDEGTFKATPLSASGDWQVGLGSGEFSWRYEMPLPKAPAGPTPSVGLRYSSGQVDTMVTSHNTQASQTGLGWEDFANSFIERRYDSCRDDGQPYSDLCWKSDNATISLNGVSSELVYVPGTSNPRQWHLRADPRWKVEQLTGANNGDNDGEHWRVTTPDGIRYIFGLGIHPDVPSLETNSAWTVPVFGDDDGEPCHTATPLPFCDQAWRWNLDRVEDPDGNAQSYFYAKEINHYAALNGWPGLTATPYVRSGYVTEIRYGKRVGDSETVSASVEFESGWRCSTLDVSVACKAPGTAGMSFPDVPTDLLCEANCTVTSPTFFSARRYTKVNSKVWRGDDLFPQDSFKLTHAFQDTDPSTTADAKLWLTAVQRTGLAGVDGATMTLPPTAFGAVSLNNRVDTAGGALSAMPHWRIGKVTDEFGSEVNVTYGLPHACPNPIPDPPNWDRNTRDCFPQLWAPEGQPAGFSIFNKYVVTQVQVRDLTGGSTPMVTSYRYGDQLQAGLPNGAWHHDRDEFVPLAKQTWSEWRGYQDVLVTQGSTRTRSRVFRGMNGDRLVGDPFPGPGSRLATVSSLDGTAVNLPDSDWLAGRTLDSVSLRSDGTTVEHGTLHGYQSVRTVDAPGPDPLDDAYWVGENDVTERRRTPAGTYARKRTQTTYNPLLLFPEQVIEHGWTDQSGDERCTRTTYAINPAAFLLDYPASQVRYAGTACSGTEVTRSETAYDGGAVGDAPTRGNPTTSRVRIDANTWATTTTTYDAMGRPLVVTNPNGRRTTTAYSNIPGYPAWIEVTNHLGHKQRTDYTDPTSSCPACVTFGRQLPASTTDPNGKRTTYRYDPLGRATAVWQPTEPLSGPASSQFSYSVDANRAKVPIVRSRQLQDTLGAGGAPRYLDTWVVYDSLLRERQTQTLSPAADKVVVSTKVYDDRGLVQETSMPQAVAGPPGARILPAPSSGWANRTTTAYDEMSRPFWEIFWAGGNVERSTTSAYTYNSVEVTPPQGGKTLTVSDAYDRVVRVEEHDGIAYRPTVYTLDVADRLTAVTDPAGNRIAYSYDMAGRRRTMDDPDAGHWSYGYDLNGNQTSITDAAGTTTFTAYDALDRVTERRRDGAAGQLLASWSYDAPGEKGLLDASTRVTPAGNWVVDVTGYDGRDRPTGHRWTVPAGVPGLSGSYAVSSTYDAADHQTSVRYPAVGGLPAETVTTAYNGIGLAETMTGATQYLYAAARDDRGRPLLYGFGSPAAPAMGKLWGYNGNQQLSQLSAAAGGATLQDLQLAYDKASNVTERNTTLAGQTWRECFGYDQRQRLTSAFTTTGTCATGAKGTGPQPYSHSYDYTADGNLSRRVEGSTTIGYSYPASGPASTRPHAPTAVGAGSYTWNANGSLASRSAGGQTETFSWDAEHRLAGIDDPDGDSSFVYDTSGARLLRRTPQGDTLYIEGHEITAGNGGARVVAVRSYSFDGSLIATRDPAGVDYLATDNLGSVQVSVPAGSATATVRTYLPYGRARHSGQHDTDRGWLGQIEDDASGLSYLNQRYYLPDAGVFASVDPLAAPANPQSYNPYVYAQGNPTTLQDPSGLLVDPPPAIGVAAAVGAAVGAAAASTSKAAAKAGAAVGAALGAVAAAAQAKNPKPLGLPNLPGLSGIVAAMRSLAMMPSFPDLDIGDFCWGPFNIGDCGPSLGEFLTAAQITAEMFEGTTVSPQLRREFFRSLLDNENVDDDGTIHLVADSNVFMQFPRGTDRTRNAEARAFFDVILANPDVHLYVPREAAREVNQRDSWRLYNSAATVEIVDDPDLPSDFVETRNFDLADGTVVQTAQDMSLPVLTANTRMRNQVSSNQLYKSFGWNQVPFVIP